MYVMQKIGTMVCSERLLKALKDSVDSSFFVGFRVTLESLSDSLFTFSVTYSKTPHYYRVLQLYCEFIQFSFY